MMRLQVSAPDDWVLLAACRGKTELFFPPDISESRSDRRRREARAKVVCDSCEVRTECLTEAVESGERFGIWGGLTERERRAAFARLRRTPSLTSPQDIAGPGRPARLPAVVVQGRPMSSLEPV
jgi:WhiB family transcriptional regulator, redox-sensing transcriptional regulator